MLCNCVRIRRYSGHGRICWEFAPVASDPRPNSQLAALTTASSRRESSKPRYITIAARITSAEDRGGEHDAPVCSHS